MVDEKALNIIKEGSVRIKVKRSGMYQYLVFKVKKMPAGKDYWIELFVDRVLEMSELQRVAAETSLPVEAENGRAFPEGKGAKDFMNI
jgi:hypothetical protein